MPALAAALQSVAVTLWVGGMWATGFVFAPLIFSRLGGRLAGAVAGQLFEVIAYIGMGCAVFLIIYRLARFGAGALRQGFFWVVVLMFAMAAAGAFGVQPLVESLREQALPRAVMESVLRERFATWHGIASGLFLIESALGLVLVILLGKGR